MEQNFFSRSEVFIGTLRTKNGSHKHAPLRALFALRMLAAPVARSRGKWPQGLDLDRGDRYCNLFCKSLRKG
jgi:hypothetical protein